MNSPNPTPPDARETLRNLIAKKVRGSATALADLPYDVVPYIADAVMDLLGQLADGSICAKRRCLLDEQPWNRAFAASPQPVEETPRVPVQD